MSFLVKTILGSDVVHPIDISRGGDASRSGEGNKKSEAAEGGDFAQTRTLVTRIWSCTVAQDRRDALRELRECTDLPYVMEPKEVAHICNLLQNYSQDGEVVELSLAILAALTDLSGYPTGPAYSVYEKAKHNIRDSFLKELVGEVPLLLEHMKEGSFWSRFHALQLLQRLEDYDPSSMNKLLLASQGVSVLVDILSDTSHDGALRNEGLVLITAITATDTELQTVLAFNNAFEKLFEVVRSEGDLDGGAVVSDCLTITHNMLRGNRATQKLFCEMGCARFICPLMDSAVQRLRDAVWRVGEGAKGRTEAVEGVQVDFTPLSTNQGMTTLMAVSVLSCIVRDAKTQPDVWAATQKGFLQCGVLAPLASLALAGVAVDDSVRVEAMRTLAALLEASGMAIEQFLQLRVVTLFKENSSLFIAKELLAPRAALHTLLGVGDRVMQPCVAQVFHALLSVPACEESVARVLLVGFTVPPVSASSAKVLKDKSVGDCGAAIAAALFGSYQGGDGTGKYYAALLLERVLKVSAPAWELLEGGAELVPTSQTHNTNVPIPGQQRAHATTQPVGNAFVVYVEYVLRCFRGQGEMDLNTLSACFRALLQWIERDPKAVRHLVEDTTYYKGFLQRACLDEGPVHVRFWSAILCAAICIHMPQRTPDEGDKDSAPGVKQEAADAEHDSATPAMVTSRDQLLNLFFSNLGRPAVFESLLFDVRASSPVWAAPPKCAFQHTAPILYDEAMKTLLLKIIKDFSGLGSGRSTPMRAMQEHGGVGRTESCDDQSSVADAGENAAGAGVSPAPCTPRVASEPRTLEGGGRSGNLGQLTSEEAAKVLDETVSAIRREYEGRIRELTDRNMKLELELQGIEERIRMDGRQREEEEAQREEQHRAEVERLNESVLLLESALSAKEEEQQVLAQSLNMLEEQLRVAVSRSRDDDDETVTLKQNLHNMTRERDELLVLIAQICETGGDSSQPTDYEPPSISEQLVKLPQPPCQGAGTVNECGLGNGSAVDTTDLGHLGVPAEGACGFSRVMFAGTKREESLDQTSYNCAVTMSGVPSTTLGEVRADTICSQSTSVPLSGVSFRPLPTTRESVPREPSQGSHFSATNGVCGSVRESQGALATHTAPQLGSNHSALSFNPFASMGAGENCGDLC